MTLIFGLLLLALVPQAESGQYGSQVNSVRLLLLADRVKKVLIDRFTPCILSTLVAQVSQSFGGSSLNCSTCVETVQAAAQCAKNSGCNLTTCYGTSTYNSCCPACVDDLRAATKCVGQCSDSCVYSTTNAYTACLSGTRGCMPKCQAALSIYASTIDNSTYYNITYEDLQNADVTCQSLHDDYVTEACGIAACCPACVSDFESIMDCVVNEVVAKIVPSLQGSVCDTTCSSRRRHLHRPLRILQNGVGVGVGGGGGDGDGFFDNGMDPSNFTHNGQEGMGSLGHCRRRLVERVAFGDGGNAAQDFTSCLQEQMMSLWSADSKNNSSDGTNHTSNNGNQTSDEAETSDSHLLKATSARISLASLFVFLWF